MRCQGFGCHAAYTEQTKTQYKCKEFTLFYHKVEPGPMPGCTRALLPPWQTGEEDASQFVFVCIRQSETSKPALFIRF